MIKENYIFDFGGVLLKWDPEQYFRNVVGGIEKQKWLFENIFTPEWRDRSDIYITVEKNVHILSKRHPEHSENIKLWNDDFFEIMNEIIAENWDIVRHIKNNGGKVFGLANFASDKYKQALERFPELGELDGILVSSEAYFCKPEPKIYIEALKKFGISSQSTVFIDDSKDNIQIASELGIMSHHYTSSDELRSFIQQLIKA